MHAGGFAPIADFLAAIHPDDLTIVTEKIRRTLENDTQFRAEYRIRHHDGDIWVIAQGKVERNEHREPTGWSGVILDVTERRRSGERNTSVLKAAMDAIISMDHHGHIIEWNPAAEKTFGYTREEAIGREMADLIIPPGLRSSHRAGLTKYLATGVGPVIGTRLEITAIRRSGEEFPVDLSITRIGDDNPPSFTGFLRDISDRKRSEEALRLSEARFRALFDSMDEGFCIVEMIYDEKGKPVDYRFLEANPTFDRHTGFQKAVGRTIRELVPNHDEHWFEIYGAVAATGEPKRFVNEAKAMGRWYDVYAFRISGPDGHRVAILFTDITSRKRDEAEREQLLQSERAARGEAERASRMKDDFLATLSHELRTPLNAILGWSQIMETNPTDTETVAEGVSVISRNARVQTQMIEDLLDMSRIISGKLRLDVKRVDLAEVVTAAIESVAPSAAAKSLRIERVLDPIAGPVSGDPSRLQQVVWNLLTNAVKFTPKGGKVQVVVERVNSHVEITVSDTGQGIKPEFLPFVFDRFRQADASTTRRFGGLGLGLSIVKQIVELHGGTVRVKSSGEGKGSSFTVNLPLSIARLEENWGKAFDQKAPESDPADEVELTGVKVLFVDDDPDARHMGKRILSDRKAEVILASSAVEALSIVQEQRPDVIVSDIGMPDADGYEFIRKVRQLPAHAGRDTPAAALTAFARSEDRRKALGAGYQSHIVKPVEPAELVMVVASLIRRPK